MSFKEQLEKDIPTFMCQDEFADTHTINNESVVCVLMSSDKESSLKYHEGTTTSYKSIAIQTDMLRNGVPKPNSYLELDGELFKVSESSELMGMSLIDLTKPIGRFNKDIEIYNVSYKRINGCDVIEKGELFHECKAYIRNQNGNELFKLNTVMQTHQCLFKIAYVEGLKKDMILTYKGQDYNITHIDNIEEDNIFIDIICERVE